MGPSVDIDDEPGHALRPKVVADGSRYFVLWQDDRAGTFDIRLGYLTPSEP